MPANKKKIAFVLGGLSFGGAERVISILANHYAEMGWQADILTLLRSDCDFALREGVKHISLAGETRSRALRAPGWLFSLRRYFKREKPQAVVSFAARINCITLLSSVGMRKRFRVLVSERNDPLHDTRTAPIRVLTKLLYPKADEIVFQTTRARDCFPQTIREKGRIIVNPVSVDVRATAEKSRRLAAVGKLMPQKDHALLIRAFSKIAAKHPDCSLSIYGDGPLRGELTEMIRSLGLSDRVKLEGWRKDVNSRIADAAAFVLSSRYEGLSNALMEALMMGLPCVSTDCAGATDLIEDGVNGLIVPVGGEDELANALDRLLSDPSFAKRLGEEAAKRARAFELSSVLALWDGAIRGGSR